jgi:hypothetical protein
VVISGIVIDLDIQGTYLVAYHFTPLLLKSNSAKTFVLVDFLRCWLQMDILQTQHIASPSSRAHNVCVFAKDSDLGGAAMTVPSGAVMTETAIRTAPEAFWEGAFSHDVCRVKGES